MFIILFMTLGFVMVAYIGYSVADAVWLQKSRIRRRVAGMAVDPSQKKPDQSGGAAEDEPLPVIAQILSSRGMADKLFLMLVRAGIRLRPSEFVAIVSGIAIFLVLVAAVFLKNAPAEIVAAIIGITVPFAYVKNLQAKRLTAFNRQLPDALSLIGSAIRSGYSFPRAMQMVADEMPAPISEEFLRVINETNVGLPLETALGRMVNRIRSYDLELVVTAVVIQQQVGGNLAEVIDNIAMTIRDRVKVEGELQVLTAEGRISGVILVLIPLLMTGFLLLSRPSYLKPLIADPAGIVLVTVGVILQLLGAIVIKRMLVMDY